MVIEWRVSAVYVCQNWVVLLGRSFAATTTEGLLVYSLDHTVTFDPFELDVTVTPDRVRQAVSNYDSLTAVMLAFRLNERALIRHAVEHVPPTESKQSSSSCRTDRSDDMQVL